MRIRHEYRACRNCKTAKYFQIERLPSSTGYFECIFKAMCCCCGKSVVAIVYDEWHTSLPDAWNTANAPLGQDEGIEMAMP